jgi:hypothetical protein
MSTWSLRSKSRFPTSVGDWMVTSALIVKAEDFKDRQSTPRIKKAVDLLICRTRTLGERFGERAIERTKRRTT